MPAPVRFRMRAILAIAALFAIAPAAVPAPAVAPAAAVTTTCHVTWGSLPKSGYDYGNISDYIVNVRSGQHACYDRLVIDIADGRPRVGYSVRYVSAVYTEGQGKIVPLRGGAKLQIVLTAPTYNPFTGRPTYLPRNPSELVNVTGYRTFRQVAYAGSFEGQTTIGLGVRARLPMRVFVLQTDSLQRLVIDVAHTW